MQDVEVVHIQCMGVARMSVTFEKKANGASIESYRVKSAESQDGEGGTEVTQLTKWNDEDGWETWTFKMKRGVGGRRIDIDVWEGVGHFVVVRSVRILGESESAESNDRDGPNGTDSWEESKDQTTGTTTTIQERPVAGKGLSGRLSSGISGAPNETKSPARSSPSSKKKQADKQEEKAAGGW